MMQDPLRQRGFQNQCAVKTQIFRSTINLIFKGKRRATPHQAEKLEGFFLKKCIPINRWDLLYGMKEGQDIWDYFEKKQDKEAM